MDEWNPRNAITLATDCRNSFYEIAFDGCFFYLTAPQECSIYKFKSNFTMIRSIKTGKPYNCICYDITENCFWATVDKHNDIIYKLDGDMNEINQLQITHCQKARSPIIGLSFDCDKDTLLIAYKDQIVEVSKKCGLTCVIQDICEGCYTAVMSIAPYYAVVRQYEEEQEFQIYTYEGCLVKCFCIPTLYCIKDVLFYPCNEHYQDELEFILLATKDGCYENILVKITICEMILCGCNYEVCHTRCREEDDNERCKCDIIESIALVETSLSHILNAEGEKLQKAVELANSIEELLAINRSVTKTIITITHLEHQLYLKLDALNDLFKTPICENDKTK